MPIPLKITVPLKRFFIDIESHLDGTVRLNIVQARPLRIIDTVEVRGAQLDSLHRIIADAWESAG